METDNMIMNLDEAIEHCLTKSDELNGECSVEHRQLAVWLKDLQDVMKNGYGNFTAYINKRRIDIALACIQGRLSSNPNIASEEIAKIVANDVECIMTELRSKYPYQKIPHNNG